MPSSESLAEKIVNKSTSRKKPSNWLSQLNSHNRKVVDDLVKLLIIHNDIPLKTVAQSLIDELNLNRNPETVARTLKELIRE
jgi:hypothetical protein